MVSATYDRFGGLAWATAVKMPVVAATTANITLSGTQTIDGIVLAYGDRVLVKDQTTTSENGIYIVRSGTWPRANDFNEARDIVKGTRVYVAGGTTNGEREFVVTSASEPVIGTSAITLAVLLIAAEYADEAATSATSAASSATSAGTSATNAATSATAAATSATNAGTSETNAAASASAAATSATNAASSATAASTSATNAATSATSAATSATNADTSETNAAASAVTASEWATKTSGTVDGSEYSAKYYADLAGTNATVDFTFTPTGGTARTLRSKVEDIVSVQDFGALGDGSTDDTAAINAAIVYMNLTGYKTLYFPAGNYKVSAALTSFNNDGVVVVGAGMYSTLVTSSFNGDIFSFDASATNRYFFTFRDMTLQRTAGGTYSSSCGLRVKGDTGSVTGLQYAHFANIRFNNLYRGIVVEDTGKYTVGSFVNNTRHGFFTFENLISAVATDAMYECVVFEGGTGPHHTFKGGQIRGSNAAVRLGTAGGDAGIGDIIFVGVHVVTAGVAIDVYGPTGATTYNQNITITGCQFDNCSTATIRMDKMKNFRILPNNSTASVGISLTSCTNYISEDRNTTTMQALTLQGTLNTTNSSITDTNGTRYAQQVIARRNVNDSSAKIVGGSANGSGASLDLYGGTHATTPNQAFLDAGRFRVRSQNGSATLLDVNSASSAIGFFGTTPAARPTGVAVDAASIHAALVTLGLITA